MNFPCLWINIQREPRLTQRLKQTSKGLSDLDKWNSWTDLWNCGSRDSRLTLRKYLVFSTKYSTSSLIYRKLELPFLPSWRVLSFSPLCHLPHPCPALKFFKIFRYNSVQNPTSRRETFKLSLRWPMVIRFGLICLLRRYRRSFALGRISQQILNGERPGRRLTSNHVRTNHNARHPIHVHRHPKTLLHAIRTSALQETQQSTTLHQQSTIFEKGTPAQEI